MGGLDYLEHLPDHGLREPGEVNGQGVGVGVGLVVMAP